MASIEANGSRGHHKFTLNVDETYVSGGAENYSTVSWSLVLSPIQSGWNWAISGVKYSVNVDGQNWSGSIPSYNGSSTVTVASGTKNVGHESNGGKWCGFDFSINDTAGKTYTPGNASSSGGMWLTHIPRYANITSFNVNKHTETSLSVNFDVDSTIDYCQYSLNNGNWTDTQVAASERNFTIGGLSENTSYNVKIRVKRQDSQLWSETSNKSQTTYGYPYCTSSPNFIIGNSVKLDFYNPLSHYIEVKILASDNTELASASTTGTSITGFNSETQIQNFYDSIPSATSGTYKVKVIFITINKIRNNGNTYSVNTSTSVPTFNLFEFEDINPTTLALTGNNQTCVLGYSTIQATVSVSNKATANNSATMSKYRLTIGSATNEANYSESEAVTMQIANATSGIYGLYAIDSRGLSKQVALTGTEIPYTNIVKDASNSSALRDGGVSEFVTLILNGSIWKGNFGQVNNAIDNVTYRFKKSSDTTWVTGTTTITPTLNQDGAFTFEGLIAGNNEDNGFDIDSTYQIEVTVTDKLSTTTYSFTLGSGIPQVAYARNGVSIMGKYDDTIGGALQVNGVIRDGVYSETERKVGYWINGKPIYEITIEYSGNLSASGNIEHNIDNIDEVVDYEAKWNGAKLPFVSIVSPTQTTVYINVYRITSAYIQYQVHSSFQTLNNLYVTIWYTKTTDTATITSE